MFWMWFYRKLWNKSTMIDFRWSLWYLMKMLMILRAYEVIFTVLSDWCWVRWVRVMDLFNSLIMLVVYWILKGLHSIIRHIYFNLFSILFIAMFSTSLCFFMIGVPLLDFFQRKISSHLFDLNLYFFDLTNCSLFSLSF